MDWSKAKTILIVAFIITNVLLGVVLLSGEKQAEPTIKQGFIEDVTKLLNKKDIFIDTEIPKEIPNLNTLTVEYEMVDVYNINKSYFKGKGKIGTKEQGIIEISNNDEIVLITNKKTLLYENRDETEKYKNLEEDQAKEIALKFLEDKNYDTTDMLLSHIDREDNGYHLEFSKVYNERYLETAYTYIEIDSRGVKSLERLWLNALMEGENPIYISTAPKAILSLLSMENIYGKTIKDISLCYYFEPLDHEYVKDPKDAKKGKTVPAWRILFEDGYKVIIDNY